MSSQPFINPMVQSDHESYKRLMLSEECARKSCYVKLKKIPTKLLPKNHQYKKQKLTQTQKHLKSELHKSRIVKYDKAQKTNFITLTSSKARKKSSSFSKRIHEVGEDFIGSEKAIQNLFISSQRQCNSFTSLVKSPFIAKKSVVIPFSKHHKKQNDQSFFRDSEITSKTAAQKSKMERNKDFPISSLPALSEKEDRAVQRRGGNGTVGFLAAIFAFAYLVFVSLIVQILEKEVYLLF